MKKDVWIKGCESGACIEVMAGDEHVAISATYSSNTIQVTPDEWREFVAAVKAGKFD